MIISAEDKPSNFSSVLNKLATMLYDGLCICLLLMSFFLIRLFFGNLDEFLNDE